MNTILAVQALVTAVIGCAITHVGQVVVGAAVDVAPILTRSVSEGLR